MMTVPPDSVDALRARLPEDRPWRARVEHCSAGWGSTGRRESSAEGSGELQPAASAVFVTISLTATIDAIKILITMTMWRPDISGLAGPRYKAIADRLAADIQAGRLVPETVCPPSASWPTTSTSPWAPITRAYAEAERRGLLRGEVGRGTYVTEAESRFDPLLDPGRDPGGLIDLGLNLPLYAEDPDLAAALRDLGRRRDLASLLAYQPFTGSERYRRSGAEWIARHGLEVAPRAGHHHRRRAARHRGRARGAVSVGRHGPGRGADLPGPQDGGLAAGPRGGGGGHGRRGPPARGAGPGGRADGCPGRSTAADPAQPDHARP